MSFRLEYQKGKDNIVADIITRQEDATEFLEERKIFLQAMSIEKAKKQRYHLSMKVSEMEKDSYGTWRYRERKIVEDKEEQTRILQRCHDDERVGYLGFKEIFRQATEMVFWNIMRKDVNEYIQNCLVYQKEETQWKPGSAD